MVVGHIKWPEDRHNAPEGEGKVKMRINQSAGGRVVAAGRVAGTVGRGRRATPAAYVQCSGLRDFSLHAGFDQEKKFKHRSDKLYYHEGSRTTGYEIH